MGMVVVGGGVPRNWPQNVAPLIEIMNTRLGIGFPEFKYIYGCRICPDVPYYGHLSGCTYKENASWRKTDIVHGAHDSRARGELSTEVTHLEQVFHELELLSSVCAQYILDQEVKLKCSAAARRQGRSSSADC